MNKKAAIQIQETVLVLFIIFVIIVIGIAFFYRYNIASIESSQLSYKQKQTYNLLSTLPNNPKLSYSHLSDEKNAIDTLKLLNINLENLGFRTITIRQIYPKLQENIECSTNNYPTTPCNVYEIYNKQLLNSNEVTVSTPVSLYFPLTDQYTAGILEIKWYY